MKLLRLLAVKLAVAGLIFAGIMVLFASVFALTGQAPAAMVFVPKTMSASSLPEGVKILRWGRGFISVTSEEPDYVRKLYASGAFLVLPLRKSGCLAYRPTVST